MESITVIDPKDDVRNLGSFIGMLSSKEHYQYHFFLKQLKQCVIPPITYRLPFNICSRHGLTYGSQYAEAVLSDGSFVLSRL